MPGHVAGAVSWRRRADVEPRPGGPVLAVAAADEEGRLEQEGGLGEEGRAQLEQRGHEGHVGHAAGRQPLGEQAVVREAAVHEVGVEGRRPLREQQAPLRMRVRVQALGGGEGRGGAVRLWWSRTRESGEVKTEIESGFFNV